MWRSGLIAILLVALKGVPTQMSGMNNTTSEITTPIHGKNYSSCIRNVVGKWVNITLEYLKCINETTPFFSTGKNHTISICVHASNTSSINNTPLFNDTAAICQRIGTNTTMPGNVTFIFNHTMNATCTNATTGTTSIGGHGGGNTETTTIPNQSQTTESPPAENWCTNNPCQNGGTCIVAGNGHHCSCTTEYKGPECKIVKHQGKKTIQDINNFSSTQLVSNMTDKKRAIFVSHFSSSSFGSKKKPVFAPEASNTKVEFISLADNDSNDSKVVIIDQVVDEVSDLTITQADESSSATETKKVVFGGKLLSISVFKGNSTNTSQVQNVKFDLDISNGNMDGIQGGIDESKGSNSLGRSIVLAADLNCAFFNTSTEKMSETGCEKDGFQAGKSLTCNCSHTTVFAALMSVKIMTIPQGVKIVSYIAELTSIIFLLLTVALLTKVRNRVRGDRVKVQICLAFSLLMLHVINVFHDLALPNDKACEMIAVLTHYFLLCSAIWMLMEGITLLFKTLDNVMRLLTGENAKKFAIFRYVVSFCTPFVFVVISAAYGFSHEKYMPINELYKNYSVGIKYQHCWLGADGGLLIGSVIIPIALILFVCIGIAIRMFYIVYKMSAESVNYKPTNMHRNSSVSEAMDLEHIKAALKATLVLLPVVGVPWFLGFFTGIENGGTGEVFMYLNAIINGFQGLFIFFVYCVLGKEVRKAIYQSYSRAKESISLGTTSNRRMTTDQSTYTSSGHGTMSTNMTSDPFSEGEIKIGNGNTAEEKI